MEMQQMSMLKIGPFPNVTLSSSKHEVWDEKGRNKIAQIFISYDNGCIKSLVFQYVEEDGKLKLSPILGCQNLGSNTFETVTFKEAIDNEYITRVSGSHNQYKLMSLTIETNVATYGPFGITDHYDRRKFQIDLGHGDQFGGFHGTSCTYSGFIKSIGVYLKPIQDLSALSKKNYDKLSHLSVD